MTASSAGESPDTSEAGPGVGETLGRWPTEPSQCGSISWAEHELWLQLPPPLLTPPRQLQALWLCPSLSSGRQDRKQKGCLATAFCPGRTTPCGVLSAVGPSLPTSSLVSTDGAPLRVRPVPGAISRLHAAHMAYNLAGLTRPAFPTK